MSQKIAHTDLVAAFEARFDYASSRSILRRALKAAQIGEKGEYNPGEAAALAAYIGKAEARTEVVVARLLALSGGAPAPVAAAPVAVKVEAPAPVAKVEAPAPAAEPEAAPVAEPEVVPASEPEAAPVAEAEAAPVAEAEAAPAEAEAAPAEGGAEEEEPAAEEGGKGHQGKKKKGRG